MKRARASGRNAQDASDAGLELKVKKKRKQGHKEKSKCRKRGKGGGGEGDRGGESEEGGGGLSVDGSEPTELCCGAASLEAGMSEEDAAKATRKKEHKKAKSKCRKRRKGGGGEGERGGGESEEGGGGGGGGLSVDGLEATELCGGVASLEAGKLEEDATSAGRNFTVSIALPGSIVANAQSLELKTWLAGQIARAAAVFSVDEVVVFDEAGTTHMGQIQPSVRYSDPNLFLSRILQYLETPQYLRKVFFPMHPDLKFAGLLNPLDSPHHVRIDEEVEFREGVVLNRPIKAKKGSYVDCGLRKSLQIDRQLKPGVRVTVQLSTPPPEGQKCYSGRVVSPSFPRTERGLYWGYTVRLAHSFGAVFTEAPFDGGYDLVLGTSDKGNSVDEMKELTPFKHMVVVFGGLKGLEYSLECDESLHVSDISDLFHHYINTCPSQGSRTIRTEEAVLITMAALRPLIIKYGTRIF